MEAPPHSLQCLAESVGDDRRPEVSGAIFAPAPHSKHLMLADAGAAALLSADAPQERPRSVFEPAICKDYQHPGGCHLQTLPTSFNFSNFLLNGPEPAGLVMQHRHAGGWRHR